MTGPAALEPSRKGTLVVLLVALVSRVAIVIWGARFPATADGTFYDTIARRIAHGHGYTWLWPDGAVTYAAHYPVGYPAFLAIAYRLVYEAPVSGMAFGALVSAASSVALYRALCHTFEEKRAIAAAVLYSLHPALLAYGIALMTEGLIASLLVLAFAATMACVRAIDPRKRAMWLVVTGLTFGLATLVRPQCLVLAPFAGLIAGGPSLRKRLVAGAIVLGVCVALCLPWTVRNCVRLDRCMLVSANAGWNLLIGTQTKTGSWQSVEVPPSCREVFSEAEKDACFNVAARRVIAEDPAGFVGRIPKKLAVTFDYFGGAPWYLHAANPTRFTDKHKTALGVAETAVSRGILLAAALSVGLSDRRRKAWTMVLMAACVVSALSRHAWWGYGALALLCLVQRGQSRERQAVLWFTGAHVLITIAFHATFFGAGRYGLVVVPFVTALAFWRAPASESYSV